MPFDSLELKHRLSLEICCSLPFFEVVLTAQKLLITWDAVLKLASQRPLVLLYLSLSQEIPGTLRNRK